MAAGAAHGNGHPTAEAVADYLLPGVQSRVHLRDGTELLVTASAGEISTALGFAFPQLSLAYLIGGGCRPAWESFRSLLEQEKTYGQT